LLAIPQIYLFHLVNHFLLVLVMSEVVVAFGGSGGEG
jgi:hypothetical protein